MFIVSLQQNCTTARILPQVKCRLWQRAIGRNRPFEEQKATKIASANRDDLQYLRSRRSPQTFWLIRIETLRAKTRVLSGLRT